MTLPEDHTADVVPLDKHRRAAAGDDTPGGEVVPAPDTAAPDTVQARPADHAQDDVIEGRIVRYKQPVKPRPVLPVWLTDSRERDQAIRWAIRYYGHEAAWQAVRVPRYAVRVALWAPRGAFRSVRWWAGWVFDTEARELRAKAVQGGDASAYLALAKQRNDRVRTRLQVSGGIAGAAVVAAGTACVLWPAAPYVLALAALLTLAYVGRPIDRAIIDRARITEGAAPKLTPSMVVKALGALGNAEINKALSSGGDGITFAADPTRDGPGWRADVDLPLGVTVGDIVAKRERLASGLRRNLGCVWPLPDPDAHEGRLVLWVGDQPLRKLRMPRWPLAEQGAADVFKPVPFGVNHLGRPVEVTLMFSNALIGAMPRIGKTFSLRVLLLGVSLDPSVEMRVFELKGTGDLAPLAKVAHHYASGLSDEAIRACRDSLVELAADLEPRADKLRKLPPSICPENKITRQIADRRDLGLHPVVIAIDECQNLFQHPEYGEDAAKAAETLIRVGPAMGVMLMLATQRPDKTAIPTAVSSLAGTRFCLRVMGQTENDMILGTSMYKNGVRATTFTRSDLGIGYLVGEADDPQIVRTYYIDNPGADVITDRARQLREAAGTLTGVAAGEVEAIQTTETLVDHALAAFRPGEDALWSEHLVRRLAEAHPDLYGDWSPVDLGNALKAAGVERRQLERVDPATGKRVNRRGVDRTALEEAARKRP
ncbi:cell division protein FtsK [Actinomadura miaoliensis]|uniref:FtsK/SpoIIIE domain-containing protein n=1 Tax=Actinomadura miaoliensis TaxID=430685 RepID=A0ABP7V5E1_9ACTN